MGVFHLSAGRRVSGELVLGWSVQSGFGVTCCQVFDVGTQTDMWHVGLQKYWRSNWFHKMRYCRGAPLEQELSCTTGRNYWYLGEIKEIKALCGWITHFVKTRAFLFLYCLMFVKSTGQLQSSHLCISGRRVGSSGNAAKLETVKGQIFGWIKSLLAFLCWRTSLWMAICWQESGERRCFSHTRLFHMKTRAFIIGYSLFSHLINFLPFRQQWKQQSGALCSPPPMWSNR